MQFLRAAAVIGALITATVAQTFTDCQPLNGTCPADPALGTYYDATLNSSVKAFDSRFWNVTDGSSLISMTKDGAVMSLYSKGDTVAMKSTFYIFWGRTEVLMKASNGRGIVSTAFLLSDDLDEIDWETLGNNPKQASTNWYGHGVQRNDSGTSVDAPDTSAGFMNYTVDWNQQRILWMLNGNVVRTLANDPAASTSGRYPQTPMTLRLGIWAAGDSANKGTSDWAGGPVAWGSGTQYSMTVKSVKVWDGTSNATTYTYGDRSGNWNTINIAHGQSKAASQVGTAPPETFADKVNALSTAAKAGIAAGVAVGLILLFTVWGICWRRARKAGREERRKAEEIARKERDAQITYQMEYQQYQYQMKNGGFARHSQVY